MIEQGNEAEKEVIKRVAEFMCASARTAPKAKGIDNIVTAIITGKDKKRLADEMERIGKEKKRNSFLRDSKNIRKVPLLVLMGTRARPIGLAVCGLCGFKNCKKLEKAGGICTFNSGDLGIAMGSAVSLATNFHIDNRIMYTAGIAALNLKLLGKDVNPVRSPRQKRGRRRRRFISNEVKIAFGIPLSISGKNPFFDR
ncbi:MAG TPA: ferredoxin [bacterium]|nr:ferredoxin [bacterium]